MKCRKVYDLPKFAHLAPAPRRGARKGFYMIRAVSGSTGTNPVMDGTFRGALAALFVGVVGVLDERLNLTAEETQLAMTIATFLAFLIGGIWDRYVKPRLA